MRTPIFNYPISWLKAFLASLVIFSCSTKVWSESANIAVASNFISTAKVLIKNFESESKHKIHASYGSSGKLVAQITHGAPFELFLSADQKSPHFLSAKHLTLPESQFTYAIGRLALCANTPISDASLSNILKAPQIKKIALANAKLAPYGRAAQQVLQQLEIDQTDRNKWIRGENIAQTFQFLVSGNVNLAFIAKAQANSSDNIQSEACISIPSELYDPIKQDAILLSRANKSPAAIAFYNYLKQGKAREIIQGFSYNVPDTTLDNQHN